MMERIFPWVVPFLFVGMWQAVSVLLAWISGYFTLVREFPPAADSIVDEFRFASGYLRWVHFKGALHVKYGLKGLHIGPNVIFRPWSNMDLPCVPPGCRRSQRACRASRSTAACRARP